MFRWEFRRSDLKLHHDFTDLACTFQLSYPALQSYSVGVPIPFSIVVTTRTKLTLKSDVSSETLENLERAGKALFPAPPVHPLGVRFSLERTVRIKARATRTSIEENVHALSGLGPLNTQPHSVAVSREKPVWLSEAAEKRAENDEKGWWQRQTQFDSSFTLSCTPTLDLGIIVCSVRLFFFSNLRPTRRSLHHQVPLIAD
jgi:hypothetical protein